MPRTRTHKASTTKPQRAGGSAIPRRKFLVLASGATVAMLGAGSLLASCERPTGFTIGLIVAVQSIQDAEGSIPLVASKRTIIRVFPISRPGAEDTTNIRGLCLFSHTASDTPFHTSSALNGPISSHPNAARNLDRADQSLDFEAPLRFGDTLTVECRLIGDGGLSATATTTLHFQTNSRTEYLRPVLITPTGYSASPPTMNDYEALLEGVRRRLPVTEDRFFFRPNWSWTTDRAMTSDDDFFWIASDLAASSFWQIDEGFPTGIIPAPPGWNGGTTGISYNNLVTKSVLNFTKSTPDQADTFETSFAHEFSHHYGLRHAGGCGSPSDVDPSLPTYGDMTGMDVGRHRIISRGTPELMSYCGFLRWPSSITYNRVLTLLPS